MRNNELKQKILFYLPFVIAVNEYLRWLAGKQGLISGFMADLFKASEIPVPALFQNPFIALYFFLGALACSKTAKQQVQELALSRWKILVEPWVHSTSQGLLAFCLVILSQQGLVIASVFKWSKLLTSSQVGFEVLSILVLSILIMFFLLNLPEIKEIPPPPPTPVKLGNQEVGLYRIKSGQFVILFTVTKNYSELTRVLEAGLVFKSHAVDWYAFSQGYQFVKPTQHPVNLGILCLEMTWEANVTSNPRTIKIEKVAQAALDTEDGFQELPNDLLEKAKRATSDTPEYVQIVRSCEEFFKYSSANISTFGVQEAATLASQVGLLYTQIDEAFLDLEKTIPSIVTEQPLNGGIFWFKVRVQSISFTQKYENRKTEITQKLEDCFARVSEKDDKIRDSEDGRLETLVKLIKALNGNIPVQDLKDVLNSVSSKFVNASAVSPLLPSAPNHDLSEPERN